VPALPAPGAAAPAGQLVFDSSRTGNFEIFAMSDDGTGVAQLTRDGRFDSWWARLSPDRRRILFYRSPAGTHDRDPSRNSLWVMNADGSQQLEIRPQGTDGWGLQGHAEWSPDGTELVMAGGSRLNPQIHVTSASGQKLRQITSRGGTNIDPSWLPDGQSVLFIGCPRSVCREQDYEVYRTGASRAEEPVRLTRDSVPDFDPYASPDATKMAWLTKTSNTGDLGYWNIRLADIDGQNVRRLTDDGNVNSKPAWSQNGLHLYFHRLEVDRSDRFQIFRIDSSGANLRSITTDQPGVNEYPGT